MKTILIVDDEYAFVENVTALLQSEGYRVVSASNGKDGLRRLEMEKPDLVVTDFMMPIADGRELVRGLRALPDLGSIPVIMMSSTTPAVALSDAHGPLDVTAFLEKPVAWETLIVLVVQLIGAPSAAQS